MQRAVVERRGQPEAVFDEGELARPVAVVHPADLGQRRVRLVDYDQKIGGEVIDQAGRALAFGAPGEMARIVLDARTGPDFEQHFYVEVGARFQPLRFEQFPRGLELEQPRGELRPDQLNRPLDLRPLGDEVLGGIDRALLQLGDALPRGGVNLRDALDLLAPELDPHRLLLVGGIDLQSIAPDPEGTRLEREVVPLILNRHQVLQDLVPPRRLADPQRKHYAPIGRRVPEAVNRAYRRDDHYVVALHQARGSAEPQRLDVFVDRGVLLDVDVGRGNVGFGLVVVVIRDEVLHRIARQKLLELAVELRRERLVVREHQRRAAVRGDHVRQRHRLPRARDAEQGLIAPALFDTPGQLLDGAGLVAGRREGGDDFELRHGEI